MPPKRPPPIEDPPSASSSSEEEVEGTSSEEEEEEEEEVTPVIKRTQKPSPPPTTTMKPYSNDEGSESESESESETGSETDSDDERPSPIVKPIASKPMEEVASTPQKSKKPRSELAAASPQPVKGRAVMDGSEKDGKRLQKKDMETDGEPGEKSKLFQRKWSEEDEITLLNGLINFKAKKGMDPSKDMAGFFDFIKMDLHFDVALGQLRDKVWRLKKKFENHANGKKGEDKTFSKEHDQKAFDLSKKIWGSEGKGSGMESAVKSNGKVKKVVDESSKKVVDESAKKAVNEISKKRKGKDLEAWKTELGLVPPEADGKEGEKVVEEKGKKVSVEVEKWIGFGKFNGNGGMEEYVLRKGMELLEGPKRAEIEGRLQKLHVEELELFLKRNELVKEHAQLLLDAYNKMDED